MSTQRPALADAYSPDADRAGADASTHLPDWVVHLLALVIRFLLERMLASQSQSVRLPSWWRARPDLPPGPAEQPAAVVRGAFGNEIAWMCRRRGIGPGHKDWPELSRAIVAFGGSVAGFRAGLPACGLNWWENPNVIPGIIAEAAATPAADAMAGLLARQAVADAPPPGLTVVRGVAAPGVTGPGVTGPVVAPALLRPVLARGATGPPTGPPVGRTANIAMTDARGRSMAGPAVLIRAAAIPHGWCLAA
jgi:hypothetical protein